MRLDIGSNDALQRPEHAGVTFAQAKGMTVCFGPAEGPLLGRTWNKACFSHNLLFIIM